MRPIRRFVILCSTALIVGTAVPATTAAKPPCASSLSTCPKEGCGGGDPRLNRQKNRTTAPAPGDVEEWTIPEVLDLDEVTPEKWTRGAVRTPLEEIGEGTAIEVKAFLIEAHTTKTPETCNCFLKGAANNDIHLNFVHRSTFTDESAMVGEITPRFRPEGWTVAKLRPLADEPRYVRVTGWLLLDTQHMGASAHRATAWEIHPVTKFEVCTQTKKAV